MSQRLIRIFSRITSGARVLLEVDGLRCVAIMGVLIYHLNAQMWSACGADLRSDKVSYWINCTCSRGNFGVPLFLQSARSFFHCPFFGSTGAMETLGLISHLATVPTRCAGFSVLSRRMSSACLPCLRHMSSWIQKMCFQWDNTSLPACFMSTTLSMINPAR